MKKIIIVCSALVSSSLVTIHAQRSVEPNVGLRFYNLTRPLESKIVKGQPYAAEVVSESIQPLTDGNRIVQRTTSRVYRDSEGRVRREEDRPSGPPSISIVDPNTNLSYVLDAGSRIARESPNFALALNLTVQQLVDARRVVRLNGVDVGATVGPGGRGFIIAAPGGNADEQTVEERLADRQIEGVLASGIRRTTTIAKRAIGNEQPSKIVSEEWTSPELQVLVMTDHNDPRSGRSTYRLLKINRVDPEPSLFQVPPDYTIQRGPERGGRGALPALPTPPAGVGGRRGR